jgi:hypothetical protein
MSDPYRDLPPIMSMPTHEEGMKDCAVGISTAVHSVQLPSGKAYATLVLNQPGFPIGYATFVDRQEGEAMIALLQNAMDDADRMNAGEAPLAMLYDPDRKLN